MSRNPYTPPSANVADAGQNSSATPLMPLAAELSTPQQHFVASFVGTPAAAAFIAARNYRALDRPRDARRIVLSGVVVTAAVFGLSFMLPEKTPHLVLPLAYSFGIRALAQQQFGAVVGAHRAAGGNIMSWWKVVGISVATVVVAMLITFGVVVALLYLGMYRVDDA